MTSPDPSPRVDPLFHRLSPIRFRSPLRYPRLVAQVLWRKRRDRAALREKIQAMLAAEGRELPAEVLDAYLESAGQPLDEGTLSAGKAQGDANVRITCVDGAEGKR